MKKILTALTLTFILSACDNPKSVVIPPSLEGDQGTEFADNIKSLSEEDKQKLAAFLALKEIGTAFGGESIPIGTTVGEALDMAEVWAKNMNDADRKADILAAAEKEKMDAASKLFDEVLTAAIVDKKNHKGEYGEDYISLSMAFQNNSDKEISGLKGAFHFYDSFGEHLKTYLISEDVMNIPVNKTLSTTMDFDLNQFMSEDDKMRDLPLSNLDWVFDGDTILFADGTKLESPE